MRHRRPVARSNMCDNVMLWPTPCPAGQDQFNILQHMDKKEYDFSRSHIQTIILATDLKYHFQNHADFMGRKDELDVGNTEHRMFLLKTSVRCADVAHASYAPALHRKWTLRCMQEFSDQVEKEKALGLPITVNNVDFGAKGTAKSQLGFINFAPGPLMRAWAAFWGAPGKEWVDNLNENIRSWEQVAETGSGGIALCEEDKARFAVVEPETQ